LRGVFEMLKPPGSWGGWGNVERTDLDALADFGGVFGEVLLDRWKLELAKDQVLRFTFQKKFERFPDKIFRLDFFARPNIIIILPTETDAMARLPI